jgi:hypothetical protein
MLPSICVTHESECRKETKGFASATRRFVSRFLVIFLAFIGLLNLICLHTVRLSLSENSVTFSYIPELKHFSKLGSSLREKRVRRQEDDNYQEPIELEAQEVAQKSRWLQKVVMRAPQNDAKEPTSQLLQAVRPPPQEEVSKQRKSARVCPGCRSAQIGGGLSCGMRIERYMSGGIKVHEAAGVVAKEYPQDCSTCSPSTCSEEAKQYLRFDADAKQKLDFYIAGFSKCGTTTLQHMFAMHNETTMKKEEACHLGRSMQMSANEARRAINRRLDTLDVDENLKRGMKCPIGLKTHDSVARTEQFFPEAKLIVGVRHPVDFFQSFYNCRVTENEKARKKQRVFYDPNVPPMESLVDDDVEWKDLNTRAVRFDENLKFLGKTKTDKYPPTKYKVFLYTLDQLDDKDEKRQERFRRKLQEFLELKQRIPPLKHVNVNKRVGKVEGTVDICDSKYDELRKELVSKGTTTQKWILEEFLQSPDVTVANLKHFRDLLREWRSDPCSKRGN